MADKIKQEPQQFKIFFVGDSGVGKTYLLNKLTVTKQRNSSKYKPTIGQNFQIWEHEAYPGKKIDFQLWDTAGQEKFRAITKHHYKKGVGAVILYDITKEDSFCNVKNWIEEIKTYCNDQYDQPSILVLGNKRDLQSKRKIQYNEAKSIIKHEDAEIDFTEITVIDPIDNDHIDYIFNYFFKSKYII